MKRFLKITLCALLTGAILFSFAGCSSVPLLKGGYFSKEYRAFIKNMCKTLPVSVDFEQYFKKDGFQKEKLVTDTDSQRISDLVNALAEVKIKKEVEDASNFAVRYYAFTDESGATFTFEFYGNYLKCEDRFYETENSVKFIGIRPQQEKSGKLLVALDEAYDGLGADAGKMFISCREIEIEKNGTLKKVGLGDYELSPDAAITAPVSRDDYTRVVKVNAEEFFIHLEEVKGQENPDFICHAVIDRGVITALTFDYELSQRADFY